VYLFYAAITTDAYVGIQTDDWGLFFVFQLFLKAFLENSRRFLNNFDKAG